VEVELAVEVDWEVPFIRSGTQRQTRTPHRFLVGGPRQTLPRIPRPAQKLSLHSHDLEEEDKKIYFPVGNGVDRERVGVVDDD